MGRDLTERGLEIVQSREGVGMKFPLPKNSAHADPQWYELDADDDIEDPDAPDFDPLPTARHRSVP